MIKVKRILSKLHFGKTLLSILLAALMFTASAWQWDRYQWKSRLVETYKSNSTATPLAFPADRLAGGELEKNSALIDELRYKKVSLRGTFDYEHQVIALNRRDASGPGHHLLAPFRIEGSSHAVLVSRGFIPFADREPDTWKKYDFPQPGEIQAVVQKSIAEGAVGPANTKPTADAPVVTKWLFEDAEQIAKQLPYPLLTGVFLQKLGGPPAGEFPKQAISISVPPSTHFGYTIEWALLGCLSLLLGIGLQFINLRPPSKAQRAEAAKHTNGVGLMIVLLALSFTPLPASATTKPDLVPQQAGIDQNLNQQIDLALPFTSSAGKTAPLKDFLVSGRPTIVVPVYYGCPRLCGFTMTGVVKLINELDFVLGSDYKVLAVSFNHEEGPELARQRAEEQISRLNAKETGATGWEFLTGSAESTRSLMNQLGFKFTPDGEEFSHAAGLMVLTPEGRISRYFFDIEFSARDMRYSLIEASRGRIGGIIDHVFLYCFRFDPTKGKYSLVVWNITRAICTAVVLVLAVILITLKMREHGSKGIP